MTAWCVDTMVLRELSHPSLTWHPGNLNDSSCNSSSTDAEILVAITGHGSTRPEGGANSNAEKEAADIVRDHQHMKLSAQLTLGKYR
ncbi:hypothetical protein AVEN_171175-1 [Araneus ventricosus]|uniref:Uncharacterized protein n=1 Tax=Araneus ventricosus TaxID=182803 RepID=A0A4Y2FEK8_ARAVE|nr:hypothetical protein AVEN_171175-1 [Araneus ventricosus]